MSQSLILKQLYFLGTGRKQPAWLFTLIRITFLGHPLSFWIKGYCPLLSQRNLNAGAGPVTVARAAWHSSLRQPALAGRQQCLVGRLFSVVSEHVSNLNCFHSGVWASRTAFTGKSNFKLKRMCNMSQRSLPVTVPVNINSVMLRAARLRRSRRWPGAGFSVSSSLSRCLTTITSE